MPKAITYTPGKPDHAGGPRKVSKYTRKPACAGGRIMFMGEARLSGRPGEKNKKTCCKIRGSRSVLLRGRCNTPGKPDNAGGPPRRLDINLEAGLCRRPCGVRKGSPTMREAR